MRRNRAPSNRFEAAWRFSRREMSRAAAKTRPALPRFEWGPELAQTPPGTWTLRVLASRTRAAPLEARNLQERAAEPPEQQAPELARSQPRLQPSPLQAIMPA